MSHMEKIFSFGSADADALAQLRRCLSVSGEDAIGVLCADHHKGYGMPIGGVIASKSVVMPAGVGYDIGCGNYAVETPVLAKDVNVANVMDEIAMTISFGMGRKRFQSIDTGLPIFHDIAHAESVFQRGLLDLAIAQLGTVGSGNHYVNLFEDRATGRVWIGVHFGSRAFGHKTATHYLEETAKYLGVNPANGMDDIPLVLPRASALAIEYLGAMRVAGQYAFAGREWVVNRVLRILGTQPITHVHNHHNYAWFETHDGEWYLVTRKGATPAFPGQMGFVGGSMGEDAVIIRGENTPGSRDGLFSAMIGAGRAMGRMEAAGKYKNGVCVRPGKIDWQARDDLKVKGIELRGGAADEAPLAYKRLPSVIAAHGTTITVMHTLRPIGVAMAGANDYDPYKD